MNEQEFSQKVMVYSGKFYRYSYKILGNKEDAHDTVQDLYVKLWTIRKNLNSISNIEAFATTIVRNLCIDRLKKIKSTVLDSGCLVKLSLVTESNNNEDDVEEVDVKIDLVRRVLKKLPEMQQKIFLMRDFEEKEYDTISNELGISEENLRVMLSRARKKIRELIETSR
ncbi:MAG: RNA polymerase sigma factor [Bacteroidales bacterium]|nr:RNA polymerase sigma factor [Bacteroidales bacterium]